MFICYRNDDDSWTKAINMGVGVNSSAADMCSTISPDGKYLFFASMRTSENFDPNPICSFDEILNKSNNPQNGKMDIYWVDAKIIEELKLKDKKP